MKTRKEQCVKIGKDIERRVKPNCGLVKRARGPYITVGKYYNHLKSVKNSA